MALSQIIIFVIGSVFGSFLNSVVYRLEKDKSFVKGGSFCPECGHSLSWKDLVPLASFIFLRGKCRYCRKKISWQYPAVEFSTGMIFLLIFRFHSPALGSIINGLSISQILNLAYYFVVASFLIIIFVYDLRNYIIPDKVIYPAIAVALVFNSQFLFSNEFLLFKSTIFSAIAAGGIFLFIFLISKGKWMGFGDIKLAFFMGQILGWPDIAVALFLSVFIGAIMGLALIFTSKKNLKSEIPFAPFLVTGTFLALFFGEQFVRWYSNLFLV